MYYRTIWHTFLLTYDQVRGQDVLVHGETPDVEGMQTNHAGNAP